MNGASHVASFRYEICLAKPRVLFKLNLAGSSNSIRASPHQLSPINSTSLHFTPRVPPSRRQHRHIEYLLNVANIPRGRPRAPRPPPTRDTLHCGCVERTAEKVRRYECEEERARGGELRGVLCEVGTLSITAQWLLGDRLLRVEEVV